PSGTRRQVTTMVKLIGKVDFAKFVAYRPNMRDQIYEVTPQRQMALLSSMLFIHGILIYLYLHYYGFPGDITLLICYLGFFMFDGLPVIVLHLQYLSANR